jgi:hypothetical protein
MKIIDHTPYFNTETGEITFLDRVRAIMKFGTPWVKEVEAQNQIIPVLGKVLDRDYTLLRNVAPPGLDASFPLILVGPTGVFVMYVTPLTGMFRAKGDQWGTISGNAFKNEKPNLMTRTEHMARAIQIFLQRQGYLLTSVEAILLCSDPSVHVDSIRPIIRVVMRDALERFAISITQARAVFSPEAIQDVIGRILNPPIPTPPGPAEEPAPAVSEPIVSPQLEATSAPAFAFSEHIASQQPETTSAPAFAFPETLAPATENKPDFIPAQETQDLSRAPMWNTDLTSLPDNEAQEISSTSKSPRLNKNQWALLIAMFVIWVILIGIFLFVVIRDQWPFILSLLP